jgi:hypothetical protein
MGNYRGGNGAAVCDVYRDAQTIFKGCMMTVKIVASTSTKA